MFDTKRARLCLGLMFIAVLCAHHRVIAEEIGTTPDGNVIYQFQCRDHIEVYVTTKLNWPNHISEHPEFDITGSGSVELHPQARLRKTHTGAKRSGQVLRCEYQMDGQEFHFGSLVIYKYEVQRDIISCRHLNSYTEECILKSGGGGGTSSPTPTTGGGITSTSSGMAQGCCTILPNPTLKGRLGRLVVAFPDGAVPKNTRVDVMKDGKVTQGGYGNQTWELLPGTYEIKISGKSVPNVTVKAGHDTTVKVGVLRVSAGKDTSVGVLDGGNKLTSGYGNQVIGLPPGSFDIQVAGQTERVTISEGQVTDF